VKLLLEEPGSTEAEATWDAADRRLSTRLLYVEARAALGTAIRDRRVRPRDTRPLRRRLDDYWTAVDPIEVDEQVVARAGDLADEHALRGYDAVHLASAEAVSDDDTWFVAADTRLVAAAQGQGLATLLLAE
jgi:hypothetical protein